MEQLNRRNARQGRAAVEAIYTAEDATACLTSFRPVAYEEWTIVAPGLRCWFWNADTLLGSADRDGGCGGWCRWAAAPALFGRHRARPQAPPVRSGSSAGLRLRDLRIHLRRYRPRRRLPGEASCPAAGGGAVCRQAERCLLIPSFAVERTQELLVDLIGLVQAEDSHHSGLHRLAARHEGKRHLREPRGRSRTGKRSSGPLGARQIRLPKPSSRARRSTDPQLHHDRGERDVRGRPHPPPPQGMAVARRGDGASRRLPGAGGRSDGLLDGAPRVRLMERSAGAGADPLADLYSGHADRPELSAWMRKRLPVSQSVFLVHGEVAAIEGLKERFRQVLDGDRIIAPALDSAFELTPSGPGPSRPNVRRITPERVEPHGLGQRAIGTPPRDQGRGRPGRGRAPGCVVIRRLRRALGQE